MANKQAKKALEQFKQQAARELGVKTVAVYSTEDADTYPVRYADEAGKEAYIRTAQFVIFLALRQLWPEARAKMNCTLGSSVYFQIVGCDDFSTEKLRLASKLGEITVSGSDLNLSQVRRDSLIAEGRIDSVIMPDGGRCDG